jgi:hypothetical protein
MQRTEDLVRRPSPATRPHPLAYLDGLLWMGSWDTDRIYSIEPGSWSLRNEIEAPGKPYGMAALGKELLVVVGIGEDDDRYLYRLSSDGTFDTASKTPCPDFTGSYLAVSGSTVYLGQMTFRRIVRLNSEAAVEREFALPTRCAGIGFGADGRLYMISGDEELEHLTFGTLDLSPSEPRYESLRSLPDEARSLVYDGSLWWTCLRDANEIASFTSTA